MTGPSPASNPEVKVERFLDDNAALFGYGAGILDTAVLVGDHLSANTGMRSLLWTQELRGIPILEGQLVAHVTQNGELVTLTNFRKTAAGIVSGRSH